MRIAVINETSSADRNADILAALDGRGHEVANLGMRKSGEAPELSYVNTACMAALVLGTGRADFVVGGCGTGQGFLNAVLAFPGLVCGHLLSPLDAWLFARINAGNCASLALNQGYGWASDVNLRLVFDELFPTQRGGGYPAHREEPQRASRALLAEVDAAARRPLAEIVHALPAAAVLPALSYPGFIDFLVAGGPFEPALAAAIGSRIGR